MIRHRFLLAALVAVALPTGIPAQEVVQPLGRTEADNLADQMRRLAADPRNIDALATAGELSIRLGDLSGAAALFARADKVDPRSGRVKAGMGSILVRSERPGEALRFFQQAESRGWASARFAADRGLAYDLIGEQERAQRDYRLALRGGADDETARRYALSLGISGRQAQALEQLDPLVRRQDRAAWRARAFVMAMNGDTGGAARIATTMMPASMAQGLGAFFQRLPTLSSVDRAFAVHFGEIYATPERLADARLTPALATLPPEPGVRAPVQVAAVGPAPARRAPVAVATPAAMPAPTPPPPPTPTPTPTPTSAPPGRVSLPQVPPPRQVAVAAAPRLTPVPPVATSVAAAPVTAATMREPDVRVAAAPARTAAAVPPAVVTPALVTPALVTPALVTPAVSGPPDTLAQGAAAPARDAAATPAPVLVAAPPAAPPAMPPTQLATTPPPAAIRVAPVQSSAATDRADSVLARIVASLSIPASELGITPIRPDPAPVPIPATVERTPASSVGRRVVAEAAAKEVRDATVRRTVAARLTGDPEADEPAPAGRRARLRKAAEDARLAALVGPPTAKPRKGMAEPAVALDPRARRAAERKALAERKAAADKKAIADKAAAAKKAARGAPARIWVQVAGGANEGDLGKAWRGVQAKAPALKGKAGYATPLRATNRVLTGPFKTDAEARAFVNQLARQGVSGFAFTSDAGQDVKKLDGR